MKFALVTVGAVVAVGVVAASVVALTANDDAGEAADHPAGTPSTSASPTETETTIDPVTGRDPQGRWKVTNTVVSTTYDGEKVGAHQSFRWTFQPDCDQAGKCGGTIKSSSGSTFAYTWDGQVLTIIRPESKSVDQGLCFNSDTNEKAPGSHYKTTLRFQKRVKLSAVGEVSATKGRFSGTWTARSTYSELVNCENTLGTPHGTYRWTVTR